MGCHERGCNLDFLEKLVFGSSSEILRNPVQKTGSQKTQNSRVMPLFSRSEIIFVVGAPFSTMYMPTELYRKGSETPHIITGIHRKSMQMNKKHISWEIEHMSSKSIFLCILRVNSITQCHAINVRRAIYTHDTRVKFIIQGWNLPI